MTEEGARKLVPVACAGGLVLDFLERLTKLPPESPRLTEPPAICASCVECRTLNGRGHPARVLFCELCQCVCVVRRDADKNFGAKLIATCRNDSLDYGLVSF